MSTTIPIAAARAWLIPIDGPPLDPLSLEPSPSGHTLGRRAPATLLLPPEADRVSRVHCRLTPVGAGWVIEDLNSRWGTILNGVRLQPMRSLPIAHGDYLRLLPWTFLFSTVAPGSLGIETLNDIGQDQRLGQSIVQTVATSAGPALAPDLSALLLETVAALHSAETEAELAKVLLDAARRGTGLTNAAMLRPAAGGRIEVILSLQAHQPATTANTAEVFSRSLLSMAAKGQTAELIRDSASSTDIESSIFRMKITAAICAPLMLGGAPVAYLYLDTRRGIGPQPAANLRPGGSIFVTALARMASLCLANLRRMAVELRQASVDAELRAAAEVQARFLPPVDQTFGPLTAAGRATPGQSVGGDFFELVPLADHLLAVAVGDVAGKGLPAALLMAVAHAYLQANLTANPRLADPVLLARAIETFNRYISERKPDSRFITLWLGVIDTDRQTLTYVDAGHGLAALRQGGSVSRLTDGGGPPIGAVTNAEYEAVVVSFPKDSQLLVVSDGVVEQPVGSTDQMFSFDAAIATILPHAPPVAILNALMAELVQAANGQKFYDDTTVVTVAWTP
jgi:serine phosphatase RsbU (regulator of sigma subunit)